ncbi:hypothetical protein P9222_10520 [Paenibacillus amylolyticus]|nr:hypothetical protein [Paenibacillus amylolyticus]WFR64523.1 hypothetical protein P9222_10520 [Paenibacillus amylolyticus]
MFKEQELQLDKWFAFRLSVMLDSGLINYKHVHPFCDQMIEKSDKPPYWLIEISIAKFQPDTIRIVNQYAYGEPYVNEPSDLYDMYIACMLLKVETREMSWASFLLAAGSYADGYQQVKEDCSYFYDMLNELEDSEFNLIIEARQQLEIRALFANEMEKIIPLYQMFKRYFRKYLATHKGQG